MNRFFRSGFNCRLQLLCLLTFSLFPVSTWAKGTDKAIGVLSLIYSVPAFALLIFLLISLIVYLSASSRQAYRVLIISVALSPLGIYLYVLAESSLLLICINAALAAGGLLSLIMKPRSTS